MMNLITLYSNNIMTFVKNVPKNKKKHHYHKLGFSTLNVIQIIIYINIKLV